MYFGEIPAPLVRQRLGVDDDYEVDGVLGFGVFDRAADPVVADLTAHAARRGVELTMRTLTEPMYSHAVEVVAGTASGPRRLWLVPVMGTAMMAYYMHMGCVLGARALVLGGSAGGLAEGMTVGDLIVPDVVTGNDSSAFYSRHGSAGTQTGQHGPEVSPDKDLASALAARLQALHPSAPLWRGATVTCEMIGAETAEDVARWSAAGFRGVEMEAAVVCAVGAAFAVPAAAAIYVADCLISGETVFHPRFGESRSVRQASRAAVIGAAFDALLGATSPPSLAPS
jgi:purine-nucleoside phosphorylase